MAAEWLNRISHATEWSIQQCPAAVNKYLPNTALGFTAASLIGAYFRSPLWLAGAALGAYVSYKASPFQQLMTLRRDMIANYPANAGQKKDILKKRYTHKLDILFSSHPAALNPYRDVVFKMRDFLNGHCTNADLHNFPIGRYAAYLKTLRGKAHALFYRLVNELETSRNPRVPLRLFQELSAKKDRLLSQKDANTLLERRALDEIIKRRPYLEFDHANRASCKVTVGNCSFLSQKLKKEIEGLVEIFRKRRTVDPQSLARVATKFGYIYNAYRDIFIPIAFQREYELAMHFNRGVIDNFYGYCETPMVNRIHLGTDQDDLPRVRVPA